MKNLQIIISLILLLLLNQRLFSQCNVSSDFLDDGTRYIMHAKEEIFINEDLENGIQTAFIQLIVLQHPIDNNKLQFAMYIDVGRSGAKQMVVPRQVKILLIDGTSIELIAESLQSPKMVANTFMQQSTFRLNANYYTTLQNISISKILILDNRENTQLVCIPYKDILKEQANCIALKL